MHPVPLETKYHLSDVDLLLIKRLITETSKQNLLQFLQHEFVNIGKSYAARLIGEMGPDFSPNTLVKSLTSQQIIRIHQLFRQAKFDDPSGDCLSHAGEYNLHLGIIKELQPDMVATYSGSAQVFEGHPFIVETRVSVGRKYVKQGLNIFRLLTGFRFCLSKVLVLLPGRATSRSKKGHRWTTCWNGPATREGRVKELREVVKVPH